MKRALIKLTVIVLVLVVVGQVLVSVLEYRAEPTFDPTKLRPCVAEDDPGPCYWDAEHRGNGSGVSFWVDGNGAVHMIEVRPS